MPKVKTHRGAAKRFKVTGSGKITRRKAFRAHPLEKKPSKRTRRARKGEFRRLWIVRINAACRQHDISYSRFMAGLRTASVDVDRKMLADLAVTEPDAFATLVATAKEALAAA